MPTKTLAVCSTSIDTSAQLPPDAAQIAAPRNLLTIRSGPDVRGFFITDDERDLDHLMHNRRQRIELAVLDVLAKTPQWTGASFLRQHLKVSGIEVGEATVGRVLSDFDMLGCTRKAGKLGRTVTKKGLARLEALRLELERETSGRKITSFFSSFKDPRALIEVLEARRAVERETARLAAAKATPAQIATMREAIAAHHRAVSEGSIDTQHDFSLHQTIAVASGNGLLMSLLEMIRKDREVSAFVRKAREREHAQCAHEHDAILSAIERRDPLAAERAMEAHLDGLIKAVRSYALRTSAEWNKNGRRPALVRRSRRVLKTIPV